MDFFQFWQETEVRGISWEVMSRMFWGVLSSNAMGTLRRVTMNESGVQCWELDIYLFIPIAAHQRAVTVPGGAAP